MKKIERASCPAPLTLSPPVPPRPPWSSAAPRRLWQVLPVAGEQGDDKLVVSNGRRGWPSSRRGLTSTSASALRDAALLLRDAALPPFSASRVLPTTTGARAVVGRRARRAPLGRRRAWRRPLRWNGAVGSPLDGASAERARHKGRQRSTLRHPSEKNETRAQARKLASWFVVVLTYRVPLALA